MIWPKLVCLFPALWFLLFLELANRDPGHLLLWDIVALVLPAVFLITLLIKIKKQKLPIRHLGLPLVFLLAGALLLLLFLGHPALRQLLIFLISLLLYLDLYYLFLFTRQAKNYAIGSLEQLNLGILGFSLFLWAASFFGWVTFLAKSFWPVLLAAGAVFFLMLGEFFSLRKIETRRSYAVGLVLTVLATEFFWAISLWPIGFLSKGAIFSLTLLCLFYLAQGLVLKIFNKRRAFIYLALTAFLGVLILGTARWI